MGNYIETEDGEREIEREREREREEKQRGRGIREADWETCELCN